MTLFNEMRPTTWEGYLSNGIGPKYLRRRISTNEHPNAILITGPPGTGKSLLANLYVRSTLCPNREEGSDLGCGTCPVCLGEDKTNISYYLVRDSSSAKEALEELIAISNTRPVIGTREYRRFIIIDEAELIHPTTFSVLLNPLEYSPLTTTWILISMEPEKLPAITREAMESRCKEIKLRPLASQGMREYILSSMDLDEAVVDLVIDLSEGSLRKAWSIIELLVGAGVTGIEEASKELLGNLHDRGPFWRALRDSNEEGLKSIVSSWSGLDPSYVAKYLMRDITTRTPINTNLLVSIDRLIRYNLPLLGGVLLCMGEDIGGLDESPKTTPLLPVGEVPTEYVEDLKHQIISSAIKTSTFFSRLL